MNWLLIKERLINKLSPSENLLEQLNHYPGRKAAVLVALFSYNDELYILFTKRSANLKFQPNDVCFPGGKEDGGDETIFHTALRETYEEIGLHPSQVDVLCQLVPFVLSIGITIIPVVGVISNVEEIVLQLNSSEVADVFACPLELFIKDPNYRFTHFEHEGNKLLNHSFLWSKNEALYDESAKNAFYKRVFHDLCGKDYSICGITALISILVASASLDLPPVFKSHSYTIETLLEHPLSYAAKVFAAKL